MNRFFTLPIIFFLWASHASAELKWYKGNTHAHSIIWKVLHGDSTPKAVAKWYYKRGYNFLGISNHNKLTDIHKVKIPKKYSDNFILIQASEVTSDYRVPGAPKNPKRIVHSTAWNINSGVDWTFGSEPVDEIIKNHIRGASAARGFSILNHPNFRWQVKASDILKTDGLRHFELFNTAPFTRNEGAMNRASTEQIWDEVLSEGRILFGIASDDAHHFKKIMIWLGFDFVSPPGGAWIMVKSNELSAQAISDAIWEGDFYASTGVLLSDVKVEKNHLIVNIDSSSSLREFSKAYVRNRAQKYNGSKTGFETVFITDKGRTHSVSPNIHHRIALSEPMKYIRARITYYEPSGKDGGRKYTAWTQPVFTDARKDLLKRR